MVDSRHNSQTSDRRKKKYRHDGTPSWGKRSIDGPGIWVSCVKGKEKQTVGELCDLFDSLASELWPVDDEWKDQRDNDLDSDTASDSLSIEAQIANEVAAIKRPRREQRFTNCQTNTPCVVFISCKPPIDPVRLVVTHVENVRQTGVTQTRYAHRLVPVLGTCVTNLPEIQALCNRIFTPFFARDEKKHTYKIELRIRNHTTLSRPVIIQHVAQCVPESYTVDLDSPEIFILVEIFKSVCGVSIVKEYYQLQKFNVMEIANNKNRVIKFGEGESRILDHLSNSSSRVEVGSLEDG